MNLITKKKFFKILKKQKLELTKYTLIGIYGLYRSKVRPVVENPDSQFVAMPQSITPAGIELNPTTEPIDDPAKQSLEPIIEENKPNNY